MGVFKIRGMGLVQRVWMCVKPNAINLPNLRMRVFSPKNQHMRIFMDFRDGLFLGLPQYSDYPRVNSQRCGTEIVFRSK